MLFPFPSLNPGKARARITPIHTSSGVSVAFPHAQAIQTGHPKAAGTYGNLCKSPSLVEIYRSVPATSPGTERKAMRQKTGCVFYISELASSRRAWSGMTGVVNSLKQQVIVTPPSPLDSESEIFVVPRVLHSGFCSDCQ